ncbi:MAG: hypothetical protein AAFO73_10650 [Pseudomonadota bacterium]
MAQHQISENLIGAVDVMLGRDRGMQRMDLTPDGFWKSFWGLLLALLLDAFAFGLFYPLFAERMDEAAPSRFVFIFGSLIASFIGYAAAMLALFLLCRSPDEARGFPTSLAVHNWSRPVLSAVVLPLYILIIAIGEPGQPTALDTMLGLAIMAALVVAGVRILRISLLLTPGKAIGYFALTTLVFLAISSGLESLFGLTRS